MPLCLIAALAVPAERAGAAAAEGDLSRVFQIVRQAAKEMRTPALNQALSALKRHAGRVGRLRYLTVIDLAAHSSAPRMFVFDTKTGKHESMLVAHGKGSDPDHDGYADHFSNTVNSRMSSVGAYVTGETYFGRHGLSLRLDGLDATNDRARERAIVMHGADYVAPERKRLGRSWGCPAIDRRLVKRVLPKLAGGTFLYVAR